MSIQKNTVWRFFASVKLALIVLIILAVISIIGTFIKQVQDPAFYIEEYGASLARIFEVLDFTNMYHSWWYVALLCLFAINLVVCSIERLPGVWQTVFQDNLDMAPKQLEKLGCSYQKETKSDIAAATEGVVQSFKQSGWHNPQQLAGADSVLIFVQKGAWTRFGVYAVHLSILVILVGAIIGSLFGFQAFVFLPEERSTSKVYLRYSKEPVALGYELRCDRFEKTYYPNGMIKQYRADLTVIDPNRDTPFQKSVVVNDPLSYRGLNFFVGDSYPMQEFFINIRNLKSGQEQAFRLPAEQDVLWPETTASVRIEELLFEQDGTALKAKISFTAEKNTAPAVFWIADKETINFQQAGTEFVLSYRQYHSAFLLVTKDPGVLTVYSGSALMIIGLFICFFMSHRRIWVQLTKNNKKGTRIQIGGLSNKNKIGFEQKFQKLIAHLEGTL